MSAPVLRTLRCVRCLVALPDREKAEAMVNMRRNRGGVLFGASWSHDRMWSPRLTHFYLGWWVLTVHSAGRVLPPAEDD